MQPIDIITQNIQERRSIYPPSFIDKEIPSEVIENILTNANYAPTHKLTEPWRFRVIHGDGRQSLSDLFGAWYDKYTPQEKQSTIKRKQKTAKPLKSSHIIAICMQRDADEKIPEWEEIASVSMAVQNMWLTAQAHNVGSYWSSMKIINTPELADFLHLKEGERCLGFMYLGYHNAPALEARRTPIENKITWISQ